MRVFEVDSDDEPLASLKKVNNDDEAPETSTSVKQAVKGKAQKSFVWKHFMKVSNESALCRICKKFINRNNYSTTGMRKHLKVHGISEATEDNEEYEFPSSPEPEEKPKVSKATMKIEPFKSFVWKHFKKISNKSALCTICNKFLSRNNGATTGLRKHLKVHGIYEEIEDNDELNSSLHDPAETNRDNSNSNNKSWVWSHFQKTSNDKALCNLCNNTITRSGGRTTGMKNHLEYKHNVSSPSTVQSTASSKEKNCYVCATLLHALDQYELITLAGFTETPIYKIIGKEKIDFLC